MDVFLVAGQPHHEKVKFIVKDNYLVIQSESLLDTVRFHTINKLKINETQFIGEDRYVRMVRTKKGLNVFTGERSGNNTLYFHTR